MSQEETATPRLPFIATTVECVPECDAYKFIAGHPQALPTYWSHDPFCPMHEFEGQY